MANLIGQRLGQYQIVALLGKGGMATVYRARQTNIEREVAVKVIKPDLAESSDFIRRFRREAETIASLRHPHILKLFDFGEQGDLVYLVMDLLSGGSLADLILPGPLAPPVAARVVDQIASALDYAHRRGVIHRDLKPQNVLLDEDGNAYLTDFGLAKLLSETTTLTLSGTALGTPAYMSPEQWQGQSLDARTDVYALGVMLFEMLVGKQPFLADTPYSMMHKHISEPPPSILAMRGDLPPAVEGVIRKALAKNREERFSAAGELAAAFRAALAGERQPVETNATPLPREKGTAIGGHAREVTGRPAVRSSEPSRLSDGGRRWLNLGMGAVAAVVILAGGVFLAFLGGGKTTSGVPPANTATIAPGGTMTDSTEAAIVVASFTKTPAPATTSTPILTPTPFGGGTGKIAFSSFRDGNNGIYMMDADGQNQRRLTDGCCDYDPAWSPDGSKIAFHSERDGNKVIYVMDANGQNQRRLTTYSSDDDAPAWSPDGSKIAFVSQRDGNYEVYVMDANGQNQRNLTNDGGADSGPTWSPDGSKIAYTRNVDIYVMDADGNNPHNLTNSLGENWDAAWSPDGSKIAFITNRDGNNEIYVIDADGQNPRNLTNTPGDEVFRPAWSPDGSKIAFVSDRDGNGEIYVMDADGQNLRKLTERSTNVASPTWQPAAMPSVAALVATPATPSTPTATDIPTSAILYQTDFEDGQAKGWVADDCGGAGNWEVITEDNGNRAYLGSGAPGCAPLTYIGLSSWKDYAVELRFKRIKGDLLEISFGVQNFDNLCALGIYPPFGDDVGLRRKKYGNWIVFNQQPFPLRANDWNTVHIEVKGDLMRASINGRSLPEAHDPVCANGYVGLLVDPESAILFDDIRVWSQ